MTVAGRASREQQGRTFILAMHADEFAVHRDGSSSGRETEDAIRFIADDIRDDVSANDAGLFGRGLADDLHRGTRNAEDEL